MRRYWPLLAIFLPIIVATILVLRSQTALLSLANWGILTFTDLRLDVKNPVIRLLDGEITADEMHLVPNVQNGPALFSVVNLDITTRLTDLIAGNLKNTLVTASQVLIYVSDKEEVYDPQPGAWMQLTNWLPSQLYVGQVHVITASENTWIFPLRDLQGRRLDTNTFRSRALADYEGEPLEVNLDLLDSRRDGQVQSVALKAQFLAPQSQSEVNLDGMIEGRQEKFRYDFQAQADYRDISKFLDGLDTDTVLSGAMRLEARMIGNMKRFTLSDATVVLDNMPSYGFEAAGDLEWERDRGGQFNLIAAGEMSNLGYLVDWIDLDIAALGSAQASVSLSGDLDAPTVENFLLITESNEGLTIKVSGKLSSLGLKKAEGRIDKNIDNEIRIDAHAPSLSTLEQWLGTLQFDPGPWRASWIMRGNTDAISLHNIVLETGSEQTQIFRVEGGVGEIANTPEIGLAALSEIDLAVSAHTDNSAYLAALLDMNLPHYLEIAAELQISGSGERIELHDGVLNIHSGDLSAEVFDVSGLYRIGENTTGFSDIAGRVDVSVSDTAILSQYTALEIPVLGAARLTASLGQRGETLRLDPLEMSVEGDYLIMNARGSIEDLAGFQGIHLKNRIDQLDMTQVLSYALDDFQYAGDPGNLQGSFDLTGVDQRWSITNLALETSASAEQNPIEITAKGNINDLTGVTTADLAAKVQVHDTLLMEALTGFRTQPISTNLRVSTTPEQVELKAEGNAGSTQIEAHIQASYDREGISQLATTLSIPQLYLADLGLQASLTRTDNYAPGADIDKKAKTTLESLLEKSPRYPTDFQIKIGGIYGEITNIDSIDLHVTGEDKRYTLRRFKASYGDANAELAGIIDLNPSPPFVSLAGEALTIPLSNLSQDLGASSDIRGTLTARGGIAASGTDIPALLASLNGSVAIALEDTVIQGAAYDVLATDLLAWIYSGAALESSTHLDCTLARFDIKDGVAHTDSIYVESARMIATGRGEFDLKRRTMDLTVTPRSRSRNFQIPSKVRLRGDMSNPRPTISPISAAADASAQALMLIPKLALRLFGGGKTPSQKGIQPCLATID